MKKNKNSNLELNFEGQNNIDGQLVFKEILLKKKKIISIKNLVLSNDNKIEDLSNITIDYKDKDGLRNNLKLKKINNDYLVFGNSLNIDNLIDQLLDTEDEKNLNYFNKNFKIIFDLEKIYLNKDSIINNFKGFIYLKENKIKELNLDSKFSDNQIIKFTIMNNGNEKVTTLYSHKAKPFVDRYKFIKGFEEGDLDFYSIKKRQNEINIKN